MWAPQSTAEAKLPLSKHGFLGLRFLRMLALREEEAATYAKILLCSGVFLCTTIFGRLMLVNGSMTKNLTAKNTGAYKKILQHTTTICVFTR